MSMGVYIEGIEMPKEDEEIIIRIDSSGTVMTEYALPISGTKAVPVPPHGRLVDADAARKTIKPWSPEDERSGCTFDTVKKLMYTMLDRAPTIIPAEEGE